MSFNIPGYYYDEQQKRYFKIEDHRTAPAEASWSSENVKRRRIESQEAEIRKEREARNAGRVKRVVGVWDEPLVGGCFLGREIGGGLGLGMGGNNGRVYMEDMRREAWTLGLRKKGDLRLWEFDGPAEVTLMYIGGEETGGKSGLGVGYAVINDHHLRSSYIPRDAQDEINYGNAASKYPGINFQPHRGTTHAPDLSSISYHAPSHRILLTSRRPTNLPCLSYFSPPLADVDSQNDGQPAWRLDANTPLVSISAMEYPHLPSGINTLKPAPASSPLTAVLGTNMGVVKLQGDRLEFIGGKPPTKYDYYRSTGASSSSARPRGSRGGGRGSSSSSSRGRGGSSSYHGSNHDGGPPPPPINREIFSVDFLAQNPADVVLAAGRSSDICIIDTRSYDRETMAAFIRHKSSVAHVRSVGDYGVLAAGPMSAMAIYDVRFVRQQHNQSSKSGRNGPKPLPVVTFPQYKNEPHLLQIGFDVSDSKGGGLGIVAAAQEDGTVGLFSLASGKKLRSSAVDGIRVGPPPNGSSGARASGGRIVKSLMFQTLPGDTHPSLFVGEGPVVKKYSFGITYSKKGGQYFEEED